MNQTSQQKNDADEYFRQQFSQSNESLHEIVEKNYQRIHSGKNNELGFKDALYQSCIEYAAQLQSQLNDANKIVFEVTKLSTSQTASAHQCQLVLSAMDYLKIEPTYQEACEIYADKPK
jgi:hypothetical protein